MCHNKLQPDHTRFKRWKLNFTRCFGKVIAEVYSKHEVMARSASVGDWAMVKECAHYLANTAMALGIDQLYLDSKDLEEGAEGKRRGDGE